MVRTYGPAEGLTKPLLHAWRLWVNINATRCSRRYGRPRHHRATFTSRHHNHHGTLYIRTSFAQCARFPDPPRSLQAGYALQVIGLVGLPVAIGIAIFKYRLYDIDLLINRTFVYGSLTAMLALVYFGGVTATQALFRTLADQQESLVQSLEASHTVLHRRIRLMVRFPEHGEKDFQAGALTETRFFSDMQLRSGVPGLELTRERLGEERRRQEELAQQQEKERKELKGQLKKERESADEFARLKKKYRAHSYPSGSPSDMLYPILLRIDEGQPLGDEEVRWLGEHGLYATLATYQEEIAYDRLRDPWALIKASRYWRRAREPKKALEVTDRLLEGRLAPGPNSAALTTRGGALRDLGDLDAAERCARGAVDHGPDKHYPYNLLGAIYWQRGEAEEGDGWFALAAGRGATAQDQEREKMRALEEAGPQQKRAVAEYLLGKDQIKYGWAKRYLQDH
jgi:tetratricopeptide (TPR) repeat protein